MVSAMREGALSVSPWGGVFVCGAFSASGPSAVVSSILLGL
jgi:hypothetical protein